MPLLSLPRFTFINGPPGSGKSTLAKLICDHDQTVWRESFAEPIRSMIYSVFFPEEGPIHFETDLRDGEVKKSQFPFYEGGSRTFRDAMISFSEEWMKPQFGEAVFGRLAFKRCTEQEMFYDRFVFDDCGFRPEVEFIVSMAGAENCRLIRLDRTGCSFAGDSRGYIELPGVKTTHMINDGSTEQLLSQLRLEVL